MDKNKSPNLLVVWWTDWSVGWLLIDRTEYSYVALWIQITCHLAWGFCGAVNHKVTSNNLIIEYNHTISGLIIAIINLVAKKYLVVWCSVYEHSHYISNSKLSFLPLMVLMIIG